MKKICIHLVVLACVALGPFSNIARGVDIQDERGSVSAHLLSSKNLPKGDLESGVGDAVSKTWSQSIKSVFFTNPKKIIIGVGFVLGSVAAGVKLLGTGAGTSSNSGLATVNGVNGSSPGNVPFNSAHMLPAGPTTSPIDTSPPSFAPFANQTFPQWMKHMGGKKVRKHVEGDPSGTSNSPTTTPSSTPDPVECPDGLVRGKEGKVVRHNRRNFCDPLGPNEILQTPGGVMVCGDDGLYYRCLDKPTPITCPDQTILEPLTPGRRSGCMGNKAGDQKKSRDDVKICERDPNLNLVWRTCTKQQSPLGTPEPFLCPAGTTRDTGYTPTSCRWVGEEYMHPDDPQGFDVCAHEPGKPTPEWVRCEDDIFQSFTCPPGTQGSTTQFYQGGCSSKDPQVEDGPTVMRVCVLENRGTGVWYDCDKGCTVSTTLGNTTPVFSTDDFIVNVQQQVPCVEPSLKGYNCYQAQNGTASWDQEVLVIDQSDNYCPYTQQVTCPPIIGEADCWKREGIGNTGFTEVFKRGQRFDIRTQYTSYNSPDPDVEKTYSCGTIPTRVQTRWENQRNNVVEVLGSIRGSDRPYVPFIETSRVKFRDSGIAGASDVQEYRTIGSSSFPRRGYVMIGSPGLKDDTLTHEILHTLGIPDSDGFKQHVQNGTLFCGPEVVNAYEDCLNLTSDSHFEPIQTNGNITWADLCPMEAFDNPNCTIIGRAIGKAPRLVLRDMGYEVPVL